MPEGPEIRLAADRIAKVLVGETVVEAKLTPARLRRFGKRFTGRVVTAVDTRGKAMLTRFDNGLTLFSHNQLYGRWYTTQRAPVQRLVDRGSYRPRVGSASVPEQARTRHS